MFAATMSDAVIGAIGLSIATLLGAIAAYIQALTRKLDSNTRTTENTLERVAIIQHEVVNGPEQGSGTSH